MITVRTQDAPFDAGAEIAALSQGRTDVGAVASFIGLVRDMSEGIAVEAMTLEHYPGMAERQLQRIADEASKRWSLQGGVLIHRFGRLTPGEAIVLVAVAAAHRQPAFEACAFLMDWLKTKAPFWKREETGGKTRWVDARAGDDAAASRWDVR